MARTRRELKELTNPDDVTPHESLRESRTYIELRNMICNSSDHPKHVVEDVMRHCVGNMHLLLSQGIEVKIDGLGTFKRRRVKPRIFFDRVRKRDILVYTSDSVTFKPDSHLKRIMVKAREQGTDNSVPDKPEGFEGIPTKYELQQQEREGKIQPYTPTPCIK